MGLSLLSFTALLSAASNKDWPEIAPAELSGTASPLDAEAPAEILYRRIELDYRNIPESVSTSEYIRYKIYNPEKSDAYTRLTAVDFNFNSSISFNELNITARLTLPDGTSRLFTKKDIKDRPYSQSVKDSSLFSRIFGGSNDSSLTEKFLAITGVQPGSILEFRIIEEHGIDGSYAFLIGDNSHSQTYALQHPLLPTRKVEFRSLRPEDKRFAVQCFTLNRSLGQSTQATEKNSFLITATNVPPRRNDPLAGPSAAHALTVLHCISDTETHMISRSSRSLDANVNVKVDGLWSPIASKAYLRFADRSEVTSKVKKLSAQITQNLATPLEKATAIYAYCQKACQDYRNKPRPPSGTVFEYIRSIDHVITAIEKPASYTYYLHPSDFLHLSDALYQAAGFPTRGIRIPDRSRFPFSPSLVAEDALPEWALQVQIDGQWKNSMPQRFPLVGFGTLPWQCEGQMALIAKIGPQELIEVPNAKSAHSRITNSATLELAANGDLSGEAKRKYTGHHANEIRTNLRKAKKPGAIKRALQKLILADLAALSGEAAPAKDDSADADTADEEAATTNPNQTIVKITDFKGLAPHDAGPIEISYTCTIPAYATVTAERIILRPSLYRAKDKHPFASETRQTAIRLPFAWQEIDTLTFRLPAGYAPETTTLPSADATAVLHHRNKLTHDPATNSLTFRREYACELTFIPTEQYPAFKLWCDTVDHADHHELILKKS